jgi:hypothetical protein
MTSLEKARLCAEALGLKYQIVGNTVKINVSPWGIWYDFDPEHDKAQAFELLIGLGLDIQHCYWDDPVVSKSDAHGKLCGEARNRDLRIAIVDCAVDCIVKMQPLRP